MCRWTLGTIERRCGVTVLVKAVTRKSLLDPNSESGVVDPNSGVAGFSEAVTLRKY
jgi:hypothetical protein